MEEQQKFEMTSEALEIDKVDGVKNILKGLQRPFTLTELAPQVKGIQKKTLENFLNALVASNEIITKVAGKTKIFYYNYKTAMAKENEDLDSRIVKYLNKIEEKREEVEKLEGLLAKGITAVPLEDLESEIQALKERVDKMEKEINEKKEQEETHQVDPKEMQSLKREYDNCLDEYQKRKRMCLRVVDIVGDRVTKPKKALLNDMEVETDEQAEFNVDEYKL